MATHSNPAWWNDERTSTWDRVKEALARDWEQTKHDFSKSSGQELNQDVGDTINQATGKEPLPPPGQPTPETRNWADAEPAVRYGYGASEHYQADSAWDDSVEGKLRGEWDDLKSGRTWEQAKSQVRYGWERARDKVTQKRSS